MNLSGNTVLITGGATGIGYGLAESFLEAGSEVIICGRREERLLEAQKKHPKLHIKVCDVTDWDEQKKLFQLVVDEFPNLNVLVNNAGIQRDIDLTKGIDEILQGESEVRVNLEAPILLSALFMPHLMKQREAAIINVSSGLAFMPMTRVPIYCATKAAVHTYTLLLRQQLSNTSVKVYEVIPPMVDTELNKEGRDKRNVPFRGIETGEYIASVVEGLKKDEYEIYHGTHQDLRNVSRAELESRLR